MEYQTGDKWPFETHRQTADQVLEEMLADIVRNDHHGKERDQRRKNQAVDENDRPGFFQVRKFWALDFAIDLRQGLFSAHRQDGVAQGDEDSDDAEHVGKTAVREPAEGAGAQPEVARLRPRR